MKTVIWIKLTWNVPVWGIMFCLSAICIVCLPFVLFFRQLCCLSENCIFFKCENHLVLLRNEIVVCLFLQFTQIYSRFAFKWKISVQNRILFTKWRFFVQNNQVHPKNSDKRENNVTKPIPISLFQIEHCHDWELILIM